MRARVLLLLAVVGCTPHINQEEQETQTDMAQKLWTGEHPIQRPQDLGTLDLRPVVVKIDLATRPDLAPVYVDMPGNTPVGGPCRADDTCESGVCIGTGEDFPGLCVVRLCTTSADCSGRPCIANVYKDSGVKPRFCLP